MKDKGTICKFKKAGHDNDYGVIYYDDLDTSPGQSGAMIVLDGDIPINIGIHNGGQNGPRAGNWGIWLSPKLM